MLGPAVAAAAARWRAPPRLAGLLEAGLWKRDFRSPHFAPVGRPLRAPGAGRAPDGAMPQLSNPAPGPPPRGSARFPAPDRPRRRPDPSVARLGAVGGSQLFAEARSPIRDLGDVGLEVWWFGGVPPSPGQRMARMGARTVSAGSTYPPRPAHPQSLQNPIAKTPSLAGESLYALAGIPSLVRSRPGGKLPPGATSRRSAPPQSPGPGLAPPQGARAQPPHASAGGTRRSLAWPAACWPCSSSASPPPAASGYGSPP